MIRVTAELLSARTGKKTVLGIAEISNNIVRTVETQGNLGDYKVVLFQKGGKKIWKTGSVRNFPRKRQLMWDLLYLALRNIVSYRHVDKDKL